MIKYGCPYLKTTIELPDDLAKKAKAFAARRNTTLRAIIEQGIRHVLRTDRAAVGFELRDASVDGLGLQPEFQSGDWAALRDTVYRDRGA